MRMSIDMTRRGFLGALLGAIVIAIVPKSVQAVAEAMAPEFDPWAITAPPGITYNWVTCAVMGEPTDRFVEDFLSRGWKFVAPAAHPEAPTSTAEKAIGFGGLILMEKPTVEVEKWRLEQQREAKRRFPMGRCHVCKEHGMEPKCPVCDKSPAPQYVPPPIDDWC